MKKKALRRRVAGRCTLFSILLFTLAFAQVRAMAADLAGNVQGAGLPIAGSTVTLYAASTGAPTQLAQGKTDDNGAFNLNVDQTPADSVLYLVAKGGTPKAAADKGPNDAIALMTVLGTSLPKTVTVNERHYRGLGVHCRPIHRRGINLRKSTRSSDRRRERTEPGRSRDRQLGQGAA